VSSAHPPVVVGLDLGTSAIKAVALSEAGEVLGRATAEYPTRRLEPGAAEQSSDDWDEAVDTVLTALARRVEPTRWRAIGLSGMLPTLVELTAEGEVAAPAITWQDSRADAEARAIIEQHGLATIYCTTGQRLDARYLLPMHQRSRRGARIAGAKDYLFHRLTGEWVTDPSTAAGYGAYDLTEKRWDAELLGATSVPAVMPSSTTAPLRAEMAERYGTAARLPVVLGAADSVLGAYGLGVDRPGETAYIAGSSTVILSFSAIPVLDPMMRYLVTPMTDDGFGLEMDVLSTGSAFAWLARTLRLPGGAAELLALAESSDLGRAPRFLPYVSPGEQGALWDDDLVGVIHGLTLQTEAADLARGLVSGVIVESRRCFGVLAEATTDTAEVRVTGRSAATDWFRQDLADAIGRPVTFVDGETDHSAVGAALFAGRVVGHADVTPKAQLIVTEPRTDRFDVWSELAEHHDSLRLARSTP